MEHGAGVAGVAGIGGQRIAFGTKLYFEVLSRSYVLRLLRSYALTFYFSNVTSPYKTISLPSLNTAIIRYANTAGFRS